MRKAFLPAMIVAIGLGPLSSAAQDAGGSPPSAVGWSRGKFVKEADGKLAGAWTTSLVGACSSQPSPISSIDTALLTRLQIVGKCQDGDDIFFYTLRTAPAVPDGACSFDYVTIGGLIPGIFQEVTEKSAGPAAFVELRKTLPNLRRAFATKQGGGYVALIGWTDLPAGASVAEAEKVLASDAEHAKRAGFSYVLNHEPPVSLIATTDYEDGGKQRRDMSLDVIANKKCLFSIKFTGARHPDDDGNWRSIQGEFQRIRRVVKDHEAGLPTALSGAK